MARYAGIWPSATGILTSPATRPAEPVVIVWAETGWTARANPVASVVTTNTRLVIWVSVLDMSFNVFTVTSASEMSSKARTPGKGPRLDPRVVVKREVYHRAYGLSNSLRSLWWQRIRVWYSDC